MQIWKSNTNHWPNKVCDDEQLYDPVDDAHRPALYHHGLGGLVGEEVSDAAPQQGAHGCLSVQVRERLYGSGPPEYERQEPLEGWGNNVNELTPDSNERSFQTVLSLLAVLYVHLFH